MKRTSPTIEAAAFRLLVVRRFGVLSGGDDSSIREIIVSLFYVLEKGVKLRSWHLLHFQSIWALEMLSDTKKPHFHVYAL